LDGLLVTEGCSITDVTIDPRNTNFNPPIGAIFTGLSCVFEPGLGGIGDQGDPFTNFGVYHLESGGTLEIKSVPEPSVLLLLGFSLISLASMAILRRSS